MPNAVFLPVVGGRSTPPAIPTATPSPTASPTGPISIEALEREVIRLANQERIARGLPPLRANAILTAAARAHNQDMIANGFFDHRGSDGSWPSDRGCRLGYTPYWDTTCLIAENIGGGYSTPADVVAGWMDSPGHRDNILSTGSREIGLAYTRGGEFGHYWTMTLGADPQVFPAFINSDSPTATSRDVQITLTYETIVNWYPFVEPDEIYLSESPDFTNATRVAWAPTVQFTLSPALGVKTVYVKLIDEGQERISSDSIELRAP